MSKLRKNRYVADFETTTDEEDCRVWGWGIYSIKKDKYKVGNNLNSFMRMMLKLPNASIVYFHNLKFDGEFMLYSLFENGFEHTQEWKLKHKQFSTLIDGKGAWYSLKLNYKGKTIQIYDSLKIIPLSVKKMPKAFGIEDELKGDIDYKKDRPKGYELTDKEKDYIRKDVRIVGRSLMYLFNQNLKKITQASNAFEDYKTIIGKDKFDKVFPLLDVGVDEDIRESYKGGFTYVNPKYQNVTVGSGLVYDVNSLYPYVMREKKLPYGEPIRFDGKYEKDDIYDLYVIKFRCSFELKKNHIPTVQIKKSLFFNSREYLEDSDGRLVALTMTSVDFELFKEHYNVYNLEFFGGYKFKSTNKLFDDYIDKWSKVKKESTVNGNTGLRTISKLMLNSLYGKFGLNPKIESKVPYLNEDGLVKYKTVEEDDRDPVYIPVASFVTAYARKITISSAQDNFDRFLYADTDSLHLLGTDPPNNLNVDDVKLGYWDHEDTFTKGRYLRAKAYIEEIDGKTHVTCAGLPSKCHVKVDFENFRPGLKVPGKLRSKRVKGGVILDETDFTIKL